MAIKTREPSNEFKQQLPPQLPVIRKKRSWRDVDTDQLMADQNPIKETNIEIPISDPSAEIVSSPTPLHQGASKALKNLPISLDKKAFSNSETNDSIFQNSNHSITIDMKILIKLAQTSFAGRENQIIMLMLALSNGSLLEEVQLPYSQITKATGISPQHLSLVIKNLTDKNVIIKNSLNNGNSYQFNKAFFGDSLED